MMIYSYGVIAISGDKVLIVKRRDSFAFIDFMNGRNFILEDMTSEEHSRLLKYNFHRLYEDMNIDRKCQTWQYRLYANIFNSRIKNVRKRIEEGIKPEGNLWGFPKGRRLDKETEKETARREFNEEVGFDCGCITENKRVMEKYHGDDSKNYCAYYYVQKMEEKPISTITINKGIRRTMISNEIADAKWVNIRDAHDYLNGRKQKILDIVKKHFYP